MPRNLVIKDNALINASYNLELVEQRLILLSIIQARATGKGITPNDRLCITASSYMNNFNTNRNTAYQALKDACNNLFERQFSFIESAEKGTRVVRSRWVSEVAYIDEMGEVNLTFAPAVVPLITLLEKNFTSYELEQVAELNSKYAVRLYEILIAWRLKNKTPMISIDELRQRLGVLEGEYQLIANFKKWVLDFSITQINNKTNITVSYEQHKQGRKIVGFTFSFKEKVKKESKPRKSKNNTIVSNIFNELSEIEKETIQKRIAEHIQRLESKGETVSEWHKENISKKAVAERWGLEDLEVKIAKEPTRQEQLSKKLLQQQEQKEMKKQEKEEFEQKHQLLKDYFESLEPEQQEKVLDAVEERMNNKIHLGIFKKKRQENKAYEHPLFINYFYEVLNL